MFPEFNQISVRANNSTSLTVQSLEDSLCSFAKTYKTSIRPTKSDDLKMLNLLFNGLPISKSTLDFFKQSDTPTDQEAKDVIEQCQRQKRLIGESIPKQKGMRRTFKKTISPGTTVNYAYALLRFRKIARDQLQLECVSLDEQKRSIKILPKSNGKNQDGKKKLVTSLPVNCPIASEAVQQDLAIQSSGPALETMKDDASSLTEKSLRKCLDTILNRAIVPNSAQNVKLRVVIRLLSNLTPTPKFILDFFKHSTTPKHEDAKRVIVQCHQKKRLAEGALPKVKKLSPRSLAIYSNILVKIHETVQNGLRSKDVSLDEQKLPRMRTQNGGRQNNPSAALCASSSSSSAPPKKISIEQFSRLSSELSISRNPNTRLKIAIDLFKEYRITHCKSENAFILYAVKVLSEAPNFTTLDDLSDWLQSFTIEKCMELLCEKEYIFLQNMRRAEYLKKLATTIDAVLKAESDSHLDVFKSHFRSTATDKPALNFKNLAKKK